MVELAIPSCSKMMKKYAKENTGKGRN